MFTMYVPLSHKGLEKTQQGAHGSQSNASCHEVPTAIEVTLGEVQQACASVFASSVTRTVPKNIVAHVPQALETPYPQPRSFGRVAWDALVRVNVYAMVFCGGDRAGWSLCVDCIL